MYLNSDGIKNICYGYNLEWKFAYSDLTYIGANVKKVMDGDECLTQYQCDRLFNKDHVAAVKAESAIYGSKISCQCATSVLIEMTYILG